MPPASKKRDQKFLPWPRERCGAFSFVHGKTLDVDPRYIAYALGEASENLDLSGLSKEFVDRICA